MSWSVFMKLFTLAAAANVAFLGLLSSARAAVIGYNKIYIILVTMLCVGGVSIEANAAPILSASVTSFADCDPSNMSSGQPPGAERSCASLDASAISKTSFTELKARVEVNATGQAGDYFAANTVRDNVDVNPVDTLLVGQSGALQFTFDIDGVLGGKDTNILFQVSDAVSNSGGAISLRRRPLEGNIDITDSIGDLVTSLGLNGSDRFSTTNPLDEILYLSGSITATFDIIFGENLSYDIGQSVGADVPGTFADFFGTASLSSVVALNIAGVPVAVDLLTSGGINLNQLGVTPSEVPVPGAFLLMLSGLVGMGSASKLKTRKAARLYICKKANIMKGYFSGYNFASVA
jgi:hypothetical protein